MIGEIVAGVRVDEHGVARRLSMSQGTNAAKRAGSKATWNIGTGCGPTGLLRQRPRRTAKRAIRPVLTAAAVFRVAGS